MTAIQICALIALIIGAALIYWTGYRGGLIDGRIEGIEEGIDRCQETQQDQQLQLDHLCRENRQLNMSYRLAKAAARLGQSDRQTLQDIAEMLRVAAETFSAFRTGKKLYRDAIALREKAIAMAAILEPDSLRSDWVDTYNHTHTTNLPMSVKEERFPVAYGDAQKAKPIIDDIKQQRMLGGKP